MIIHVGTIVSAVAAPKIIDNLDTVLILSSKCSVFYVFVQHIPRLWRMQWLLLRRFLLTSISQIVSAYPSLRLPT